MDLSKIITNHQAFSERLLSEIQRMPFGSFPKIELELIILDAVVNSIEPENPYSKIEKHFGALQTGLKLTQTQLKNKILAAQLRFDNLTERDVEIFIIKSIIYKNYSIEGGYIVLSIFNPLLNDIAKSYFETRGIISDTSFSKSIIKINLSGFLRFISKLNGFTESDKTALEIILTESVKEKLIKISDEKPASSWLEKMESVTAIASNLANVIEKIAPLLNSML